MEGLKDKVIVFAGAGGIATATARCLGQGGAKVVVGDVLLASAELTARTCGDAGGEGVAAVADISEEEQVKNLIELALTSYGRIDVGPLLLVSPRGRYVRASRRGSAGGSRPR